GLDAFHELRERLKLCPLVICHADRDVDVHGLGDLAPDKPPCWGWAPFQATPPSGIVPAEAAPRGSVPGQSGSSWAAGGAPSRLRSAARPSPGTAARKPSGEAARRAISARSPARTRSHSVSPSRAATSMA